MAEGGWYSRWAADVKQVCDEVAGEGSTISKASSIVPLVLYPDDIYMQLRPGSLTVLGALPAIGKTNSVLNMMRNISRRGYHVVLASPDYSREVAARRLLGLEAEVNSHLIRTGNTAGIAVERLKKAAEGLANDTITILDADNDVALIAKYAGLLKKEMVLDILFIDSLQGLMPQEPQMRHWAAHTENARALKDLADRLQVPVVVTSTLASSAYDRDYGRPELCDLQPASIGRIADTVIMIARPEFYCASEHRRKEKRGVIEFDSCKCRDRGRGLSIMHLDKETGRLKAPLPNADPFY